MILLVFSMKFKMTSNIRDSVLDFHICSSTIINFYIYLHCKFIMCTSSFAELFFNLIMLKNIPWCHITNSHYCSIVVTLTVIIFMSHTHSLWSSVCPALTLIICMLHTHTRACLQSSNDNFFLMFLSFILHFLI